jgi:hypothetical protein
VVDIVAGEEVGDEEENELGGDEVNDRRWRGRCVFICDGGVGPANTPRVHVAEPKVRQMEWRLEADRSAREAIGFVENLRIEMVLTRGWVVFICKGVVV